MTNKMINSVEMINRDAENQNIPISCVIELTTQCNWKCKHCYLPEHNSFGLTFSEIKELLQDLRSIGVHKITYTGGKIFTRKDTIDIIEYTRKMGFSVAILSNASLITEEIARRLSECVIASFSMTIFSIKSSIHDEITGVKGSLDKALNGAKIMASYNNPVWIKSPVLVDNMNEIKDVKKYCDNKGYFYTSSACIFPKNDGDVTPLNYTMDIHQTSNVITFIDSTNNLEERSFNDTIMCKYLLRSFAITYNGDITPCNSMFIKVGNIRETSIFDIWKKEEYVKIRNLKNEQLEKCHTCPLSVYCDRCPATTTSEGKSFYGCSNIAKNIAIAKKIAYERR